MTAGIVGISSIGALAADGTEGWTFTMQPYLWTPVIEADLKFTAPDGSTGEPEIEVEPDDYLENLDIALIVTAMARRGKWSFTADFVFMEVSSGDNKLKSIDFGGPGAGTTVDQDVDVDVTSFISTFGAGYQVIDGPHLKMDVVAGLRYLYMESDVDWTLTGEVTGPESGQSFARSGSHTEDSDAWNGIGGIRGKLLLGSGNWFVPFYADIGTGDSNLTWSVYTAIGYTFKEWFDAVIGYRYMEWDNDDDEVVQQVSLSGPVLGARFNF